MRFADPAALISPRVPAGDAAPALGFPIFVRGELSRFVLFSGHPHGLDLDPSETALIGDVTRAASHGFARLSQLWIRQDRLLERSHQLDRRTVIETRSFRQ